MNLYCTNLVLLVLRALQIIVELVISTVVALPLILLQLPNKIDQKESAGDLLKYNQQALLSEKSLHLLLQYDHPERCTQSTGK